jgi:hypothetical protein
MRQVEIHSPRTTLRTPIFLLGQNSRGQWVVQDERHLRGGVFLNRADALRFAMFENGIQPRAVVMVPGILELDMEAKNRAVASNPILGAEPLLRPRFA